MVEMSTLYREICIAKPTHNGEALMISCYYEIMGNTVGSANTDFCDFRIDTDIRIQQNYKNQYLHPVET